MTHINRHGITFFDSIVEDTLIDTSEEDIKTAIMELEKILSEGILDYDSPPTTIFWNGDRENPKTVSVRWSQNHSSKPKVKKDDIDS